MNCKTIQYLYQLLNSIFQYYNLSVLWTFKKISGESIKNLSTQDTCLFGAVKLTQNADPDKYGYNRYGIGFDARSTFLWQGSNWDKNVIFAVDNSYSKHVVNKK